MRRMLYAAPLLLACSCAATTAGKYDQAHFLYNQAASVALAYAEQPDANLEIRQRIATIVVRTGPVVNKASEVLDDPNATKSEKTLYFNWAWAVLEEATRQLTQELVGR